MGKFLVMTKSGTTPPSFRHDTIESAIVEARRLHDQLRTDVTILEIVGEIKTTQVPVTKDVTVIEIDERLRENDLPF